MIKFIEHGGRCRPTMDCVQGELLIYRVRRYPKIEKELLFAWIKQLIIQIEQYHRCRGGQCYRYVNPYSVLVTKEEDILLLDLEAGSNEFVLKNMQKRAMREHFVKPIVHIRENTRITLDLYGFAKTVQFVLASMETEPVMTRWEEYRLGKIIDKCLNEDPKKQYGDLKQVEKELPSVKRKWDLKCRRKVITGIIVFMLCAGLLIYFYGRGDNQSSEERIQTVNTESTDSDTEPDAISDTDHISKKTEETLTGPPDGPDMVEEEVNVLEQYLLRNTVKDNQEVIRQGEKLHRELLRYLAAVYDREESKERALQAYQELCLYENQTEYLETAYVRRIALEKELFPEEDKAVVTGREGLERFPASEQVATEYADAVCINVNLPAEEKAAILQPLAEQFAVVRESESYKKWEAEQKVEENGEQSESGEQETNEKQAAEQDKEGDSVQNETVQEEVTGETE